MSDITGDAITINAAEKIEDAIEHVGYTSSQQQVGKAIKLKLDATGTDLAFNYNISISNSLDSPVNDIRVNSCTLNNLPTTGNSFCKIVNS